MGEANRCHRAVMQIAAFNEATQTLAENLAAQEHTLNYAHSFFEHSLVLLKDHVERIHSLLEQ